MVWGGLRGAVGIALAIALDKELQHHLFFSDPRRRFSSQLFGLTGGIAFLTLVINGTLAGPILKKLGLADVGEARKKVVERYREVITSRMLCDLIQHLSHSRFSGVDYAVIKNHVSFFENVTPSQIRYAVKHNKEFTSLLNYKEPNLLSMKPFMSEEDFKDIVATSKINTGARLRAVVSMASIASMSSEARLAGMNDSSEGQNDASCLAKSAESLRKFMETDVVNTEDAVELRKVFIELLRFAYEEQFNSGEIDVRDGLLVYALKSSLEVTSDLVNQGHALDDWYAVTRAAMVVDPDKLSCCTNRPPVKDGWSTLRLKRFTETRALVKRAIAFIEAHHRAQKAFKNYYCNGQMLSETEVLVVDESNEQVKAAEHALSTCHKEDVARCVGHVLCSILLSKAADVVGNLTKTGLLREQEAEEYLHIIEHDITRVESCHGDNCEKDAIAEESLPSSTKEDSESAKSPDNRTAAGAKKCKNSASRLGHNVSVIGSDAAGELSSDSSDDERDPLKGSGGISSFAIAGMAAIARLNNKNTGEKSNDEFPVGMGLSDSSESIAGDHNAATPFAAAKKTTTSETDDHSV